MAIIPGQTGGIQLAAAMGGAAVRTAAGILGARAAAPQVTVQMPPGGLNAASSAALVALATQVSADVASWIARVSPYARFGFYTFMVLLCLTIVEKGVRLFGPPIVQAAKALLVVAKVGVKMTAGTAKVFIRLSAKVIAALYRAGQTKAQQALGMIVSAQNAIGHGVKTVRAGAAALASVTRRASTAVMTALGKSAARLRTVGGRLKKAHISYKKRQAVKAEETRVKGLISKVRKSNAPLTLKEKQEYLKMAHKANSVAAKAAKEAKMSASARRAHSAAGALMGLGKRKRSH